MDNLLKEILVQAGIEVDTALQRFMGNERLLIKSLQLFLQDNNFTTMLSFIDEKNAEEAYKSAHTIKGLCGNLSMTELFNLASTLCNALQEKDFAMVDDILPLFASKYAITKEAIQKCQ